MSKQTLTVIGLGPMGSAIATKLSQLGHDVTVWNRSPGKSEKLAETTENAVRVAESPNAAITANNLLIVSLIDNGAVHKLLDEDPAALSGRTVVNLSSDTPLAARRVAELVSSAGGTYVGGVMLTPSVIVGQPGSTMVVAGDEKKIAELEPLLTAVAPTFSRLGDDPTIVAAHDIALLDAFWTAYAGWAHAVAVGKAHGIAAADLTPRLTAIVQLAADVGARTSEDADNGTYPGVISTTSSAHSTLTHIVHAAEDSQVDSSVPAAILALLDKAVTDGRSADSPSTIVQDLLAARR